MSKCPARPSRSDNSSYRSGMAGGKLGDRDQSAASQFEPVSCGRSNSRLFKTGYPQPRSMTHTRLLNGASG
jgi:hypothetical protein